MTPRLDCRAIVLLVAAACARPSAPHPAGPPRAGTSPSPARAAPSASQLERVRPPPKPCLAGKRDAPPAALVTRAASEFDASQYERALACAEEALRDAPRFVAALHFRAASLAALGRLDEARTAFARALAVDPDDPETLWGSADLYVSRLGASRESLELGLEYALRGARHALRGPQRDHDLAARLHLLAGMAENDLGRSAEALRHLDQALPARPDDPDIAYERGVALYELCRFPEARASFDRVLRRSPDDAWALHYLGLIAERGGEEQRAAALLTRAAKLAPSDFPPAPEMDRHAFEDEVQKALATLPDRERRSLRNVPVEIQDLPALDDLVAVDPPLSPSILGLYRGPPEPEPCATRNGAGCRAIVFYRKNLLRFARDRREVSEQVKVTLLHELGHLHGESDDDLRERGLE